MSKKAVIYCRVSSKRQEAEGHGLDSQEERCRQYAARQGYVVEAVFPDTISGGGDFMKRPGMVALLSYLDAQPLEDFVVIFDDLKRYARDVEFHLKLHRELTARGATRECLNFSFQDSPEGIYAEIVLAASGQLERQQNARQVGQKMRIRAERGYWNHLAPIGYKHETQRAHGRIMVRQEPLGSIVQEALEGFASGRFQTQAEVGRFLESQPAFPRSVSGRVGPERISSLLR